MEADTLRMRGKRPFVFSNLKSGEGVEPIANFIIEKGGLATIGSTRINHLAQHNTAGREG
jgi:urease accessory protein